MLPRSQQAPIEVPKALQSQEVLHGQITSVFEKSFLSWSSVYSLPSKPLPCTLSLYDSSLR